MRLTFILAALLFLPGILCGELPPSAYESLQAKAAENVRLEVLRVDVEPGDTPSQQKIHAVAMVTEVMRTGSGLKADEIINVLYTVNDHPAGWVGPGEIPLLKEKAQTLAYLNKTETGDFSPAAGRMSFSNF